MNPSRLLLLISAFVLLISCHNQNQESASIALSDSVSYSGLTGDQVKLVKTAAIRSKVKDVESTTKTISELAGKYGGMVFHQKLTSREEERREFKVPDDSLLVISTFTPTADITVRVPSQDLQSFMYEISSLGYLTVSNVMDIQDKSIEFLENRLRLQNRNEIVGNVSMQSNGILRKDLNTIQVKDEANGQRITNLRIDADVQYSAVNIELFQDQIVKKETISNYNISVYNISFGQRLINALSNGLDYFLSFILEVANLWVFILVVLTIYCGFKWYPGKRAHS